MYRVEWENPARSDLFQLWTIAPDPAAVLFAVDAVERRLVADPFAAARYLSEDLWQFTLPPLVVTFEVDVSTRTARITAVGVVAS
ncbi:MAG: hypothetical protein ACRC7O_00960 [Fimbriiglobus sp.]